MNNSEAAAELYNVTHTSIATLKDRPHPVVLDSSLTAPRIDTIAVDESEISDKTPLEGVSRQVVLACLLSLPVSAGAEKPPIALSPRSTKRSSTDCQEIILCQLHSMDTPSLICSCKPSPSIPGTGGIAMETPECEGACHEQRPLPITTQLAERTRLTTSFTRNHFSQLQNAESVYDRLVKVVFFSH